MLPPGNGDVYEVLGVCRQTFKRAGMNDLWPALRGEAFAGDREHFDRVLHEWFDVGSDHAA